MQRVLKPVCAPILAHIRRWIADGEIQDPFDEFFIENDAARLDHNWVCLCVRFGHPVSCLGPSTPVLRDAQVPSV